MPGHARKDIVRQGEIGTYHCWSRCVQRAFLCGDDPVTGQDFEHRRTWIQSLLQYQASVFAVDVGNYSILSNHEHLIARTRPDIAAMWDDEEVAWRWKLAWPSYVDGQWVREPTDQEIEELLARPERLPKLRANLASLSWFMARWKEPIAKLANCESQTKGHFFEQRFGSRELLNDAANLCGNAYVDLNQVKAGMAASLEESSCSAICDRLLAWRQREIQESLEAFRDSVPAGYELESSQVDQLLADCFLAPISDRGPGILVPELKIVFRPEVLIYYSGPPQAATESPSIPVMIESPAAKPEHEAVVDSISSPANIDQPPQSEDSSSEPRMRNRKQQQRKPTRRIHRRLQKHRRRRASDDPMLGIPLKQYLSLIQTTAELLNHDSAPSTDPSTSRSPPLESTISTPANWEFLRQLGIDPSRWRALVEHFGDWFHWAVGATEQMASRAERAGKKWLHGSKSCRDEFT